MKTGFAFLNRLVNVAHVSHRRRGLARGLAGALTLAVLASSSAPAMGADDGQEQARVHLRRASAASDLGNHVEAAREYEAAYIASSDANLLIRVGQAWQLAGDRQKAITAYQSCARVAPNGEDRATCGTLLRALGDRGEASAPPAPVVAPMPLPMAAAVAPSPPPPMPAADLMSCPPAAAPAEPSSWPIWVAVSVVVAAGIVVGVMYARQNTDLAVPETTFGTKRF
jgi:tetratricopeptide (TPR) repeat protein